MKTLLAGLLACLALAVPAHAQDRAPAIEQNYQPDPAIWLLADEDTQIYLLGTIHILPEGFRWRSERIDAIVAEADELIIEATDEELADSDALGDLVSSIVKRRPTSERLSPENGWKWLALGESLGIDPIVFDHTPPVMAVLGLGALASEEQSSATVATREFGVETVLEAVFRDAGKPVGSIENGLEVFTTLLAIDEAVLLKELDRQLSAWNGKGSITMFAGPPAKGAAANADELADMHAWAQGAEMNVRDELVGDWVFGTITGKLLLDNRNRAWAGWLENRLAQPGTVLVAVGAGHLAGDNSLQAMLAKRGLATRRLN